MAEPELSDEETRTLIDYARRKFAEERWPMSPALRPVRAIMDKLDPNRSRRRCQNRKAGRAELEAAAPVGAPRSGVLRYLLLQHISVMVAVQRAQRRFG
jgi:hypothetical protein